MKHFYLIANEKKDKKFYLTKQIQECIWQKGGTSIYTSNLHVDPKSIPADTECIICIGGDGTFIRAALDAVECKVPLIGVNRGHVGYLCELDCNTVFSAIDKLMEDQYGIENRMLLEGHCVKSGKAMPSRLAFNDVVIHRAGQPEMVSLIIYVNGE